MFIDQVHGVKCTLDKPFYALTWLPSNAGQDGICLVHVYVVATWWGCKTLFVHCPVGWEKPWVEQIVDRIMKNMLRTTEERAQGVVSALTGRSGCRFGPVAAMPDSGSGQASWHASGHRHMFTEGRGGCMASARVGAKAPEHPWLLQHLVHFWLQPPLHAACAWGPPACCPACCT